ncbi:hypothetical protein WJX72_002287 [[Myrmecia] bisecta]|uniref:Uncharacterized protein n=1 Tax=[Myrmecia] bisecta TaxID=41462 RepID=A0AAW1QPM1_9CHLO
MWAQVNFEFWPVGPSKGTARSKAAFALWEIAASNPGKAVEVANACLPQLCTLLERGGCEEKFNALGCLERLVNSSADACRTFAGNSKVLIGSHDRSKAIAAAVLHHISGQADLVKRLEPVVPQLVAVLGVQTPDWAGLMQAKQRAAGCLERLAGFDAQASQVAPEIRPKKGAALKRAKSAAEGKLASVTQRLVDFKPAIAAQDAVLPLVKLLHQADKASNAELCRCTAAILRSLTAVSGVGASIVALDGIPVLLKALEHSSPVTDDALAGCIWALTLDSVACTALVKAGAAALLCKRLSALVSSSRHTDKPSKAKHGGLSKEQEGAVCTLTGALRQVSFEDGAKTQLKDESTLALLVSLQSCHNATTYDNVIGVLWNLGLEPGNRELLEAAHAPAFVVDPLPVGWLTSTPLTPLAVVVPETPSAMSPAPASLRGRQVPLMAAT